jgi:putative glycosyltransferase (TIGR04372 family)
MKLTNYFNRCLRAIILFFPTIFLLFVLAYYIYFKRLALTPIATGAIGHLSSEVPIQLAKALERGYKGILVIPFGNVANAALRTFLKSSGHVYFLHHSITSSANFLSRTLYSRHLIASISFDDFARVEKVSHLFPMTREIERQCSNKVKTILKTFYRPIVLICCRDTGYDSVMGRPSDEIGFRNSNFILFSITCKKLSELGFFVIRFGSASEAQIDPSISNYVFDYTRSEIRTEELDIYLSYVADFVISTGTGIEELPALFNKPILKVNFLPVVSLPVARNRRHFLPKVLVDSQSKRVLTLDEIIARGAHKLWRQSEYVDARVSYMDNEPEEIWNFVNTFLNIQNSGIFEENSLKVDLSALTLHASSVPSDTIRTLIYDDWKNLQHIHSKGTQE